jgi:predicted house-cleaning noncanonical NTP pyrophosphatase (MazG superfamily)
LVLAERGETLETRIAEEQEYLDLLRHKLVEEAGEVFEAKSKQDLAEEIGDVLEVLKSLCEANGIVDEVFAAREAKFLKRGGFAGKIILLTECKKS